MRKKVAIIADDIIGALDAGVQFAKAGAKVAVTTDSECGFQKIDIWVINTNSRHLSPMGAYEVVGNATQKVIRQGAEIVIKKTDFTLQGNVGSELAALMDTSGAERIAFIPAFPDMDCYTKEGIHYIKGTPVQYNVYGRDQYNPGRSSYIPDIIHFQSNIATSVIPEYAGRKKIPKGICIFDCSSRRSFYNTIHELATESGIHIFAGCAELSKAIANEMGYTQNIKRPERLLSEGAIIFCGSTYEISGSQLDYPEKSAFFRISMNFIQKLNGKYWETKNGREFIQNVILNIKKYHYCIIDCNDSCNSTQVKEAAWRRGLDKKHTRHAIDYSMALFTKKLIEKGIQYPLIIFDVDTMQSILQAMGTSIIEPLYDIYPGLICSNVNWDGDTYYIISRSEALRYKGLALNIPKITQDNGEVNDFTLMIH